MNSIVLLKIGGSVITDKQHVFTLRTHVIERLADAIKLSGILPIIVHGTGSFGKAYSRHYNIENRNTSDPFVYQLTVRMIHELSLKLSEIFFEKGLINSIVSVNPLFHVVKGTVKGKHLEELPIFIEKGVIPILCGDVLIENKGCYHISSDEIMRAIAESTHIFRCIFVTDVDGLLDESGRLVSEVSNKPLESKSSSDNDITGGMMSKIEEARQIANTGTPVNIINGLVPGRLRTVLSTGKAKGTVIK